jgi:hypothetical protein
MRHWMVALEDEVAERGNRRENKQVGVQFERIAVDGQGHPSCTTAVSSLLSLLLVL